MGPQVEGREAPSLASNLEYRLPVDRGVPELIEGNPERLRHLITEAEGRAIGGGEDEWSDDDETRKGRAGPDVGERTQQLVSLEWPANFFGSLPEGGVDQVAVSGIQPAPGEPDMPGPRVPCPLRPANQQQRVGTGRHDDGDGGPVRGRIGRRSRLRLAAAEQAQSRRDPALDSGQ